LECQDGFWFDQTFERITTIRCGEDGAWRPDEEQIMCLGDETNFKLEDLKSALFNVYLKAPSTEQYEV